MLLLAALIALDGYWRKGTRGLGIAATLLLIACILTKDFGLVAVPVALLLPWVQSRRDGAPPPPDPAVASRRLCSVFLPATVVLVAYLGLRLAVVPAIGDNEVYAPRLSLPVTVAKARLLGSALANTSLLDPGVTGAPGLAGALAGALAAARGPRATLWAEALSTLAVAAGMVLIARWARKPVLLLFPLFWAAAYYGPTLLTRNLQIYYAYEAVLAAALLLGLALDRAPARAYAVAWGLLAILVGNALVSNYRPGYSWQFVADKTEAARGLLARHVTPGVESITFVSAQPELWTFALGTPRTPMYSHDYPEPESVVSLVKAGFRVHEAPVLMRRRQGGRSSITFWRSIYYMSKVLLAIAIGATRQGRPPR